MTSNPAPGGGPSGDPGANAMTDRFRQVGERILDALLEDAPEWALTRGDDRFADRLDDMSEEAAGTRTAVCADALGALDEIDDTLLPPDDRVDLETLRTRVSADLWQAAELRPHTWDPLHLLPVHAFDRADSAVRARLAALPARLETARVQLDAGPGMPRAHAEASLDALDGMAARLEALETGPERAAAAAALDAHRAWTRSRLDGATADPRLGERGHAARLWYALDCEITPDTLLTRAESDLLALEERLAELAADVEGRPPRPGQAADVAAELAGPMERVADAHEGVPGRALQEERTAAYAGPTRLRRILVTLPFTEGWPLYAVERLAEDGWGRSEDEDRRMLFAQLLLRLRRTADAVLDVRVHARGMTEEEAVAFLADRAHYGADEARAGWRRALLNGGGLGAAYAGHADLAAIAADLAAAGPGGDPRAAGDALLAHGAPAPRHLRALIPGL